MKIGENEREVCSIVLAGTVTRHIEEASKGRLKVEMHPDTQLGGLAMEPRIKRDPA